MKYNLTHDTPNISLAYGVTKGTHQIPFSLMIKDDESYTFVVYLMKNVDIAKEFRIKEMEQVYYENPIGFQVSTKCLELEKFNTNQNYRIIAPEEMDMFEETMFDLLKETYENLNSDDSLDLVNPGEIGMSRKGEAMLYLGKFDKVDVEMKHYDISEVLDWGIQFDQLNYLDEQAKSNIKNAMALVENNEISTVSKEMNKNTNIYLELNTKLLGNSTFDYEFDISAITPEELSEMIINIDVRHQRKKFIKKYDGRIDYMISTIENPIQSLEFDIIGSPYNDYHKDISRNLFNDEVNGRHIYDSSTGRSRSVMKIDSSVYRKIKLDLGKTI